LGAAVTNRLVMDGLKSTPCNPSMTDARDAILSADQANNNGINRIGIWMVFARHGLGYSAAGVDGTLLTGTRYDAAYDLPPDLQSTRNPAVTSNPLLLRTGNGDLYKYSVIATNPAGGTLNYVLSNGPVGMTIDSASGLVSWPATFVSPRIKITVTDGRGGKVVHGYSLPLTTLLTDGLPITITGAEDSVGYATITIPAGVPVLQLTLRGGSGDADLLVIGPDGAFAFSARAGSTETLSFANPKSGQWQIAATGYTDYSGVSLASNLITPTRLSGNTSLSGLSAVTSSENFYRVIVPPGASLFSITTSGGTGDVDIFLRKGFPAVCQPSDEAFAPCLIDKFSGHAGSSETISIDNPAAGDWYLDLLS